MIRPARANPTRSLRWSIEVEPSWERTMSSTAWSMRSSSSSSPDEPPGMRPPSPASSPSTRLS